MDVYKDDPCTAFELKGNSNYSAAEQELSRKMHKAISMIQFKLEENFSAEGRNSIWRTAAFSTGSIRIKEPSPFRTGRNIRFWIQVSQR